MLQKNPNTTPNPHNTTSKNPKFYCNICNFKTNNKKDYDKHMSTAKHLKLSNPLYQLSDLEIENANNGKVVCSSCNKMYKSRVGLWKHKPNCTHVYELNDSNINDSLSQHITPTLILTVLEQNKELTNLIVEQNKAIIELAKNGQGNNINYNNINSNNKTFNLHLFLNETCKDAMNITDFVDSLKLQLSDLENIGRLGFVEGISSIIVKNLQALDVHKRPVHCADKKREVIYVKDEDKWEKEDDDKNRIRNVIKKVACKNQRLITKYKEEHPGCNYSESKYADQYSKLVIEAMGGMGNNDTEKEDKIIQKIAKEVVINKKLECID